MAYTRVNWDENTPLNPDNLNTMDIGIDDNADDITDIKDGTTKTNAGHIFGKEIFAVGSQTNFIAAGNSAQFIRIDSILGLDYSLNYDDGYTYMFALDVKEETGSITDSVQATHYSSSSDIPHVRVGTTDGSNFESDMVYRITVIAFEPD